MEKFLFADGQNICLYDGGKVKNFPSKFIEKYKENLENLERSKNWKHSGEGAVFRGDVRVGSSEKNAVSSAINGVFFSKEENEAVYSFCVNETSAVYKMRFDDEKAPEVHVVNSLDVKFGGGCFDASAETLALSIERNDLNSDIAVLDIKSGDYKTVTEGDTLDCDPFIDLENGNIIWFSSRGVGRKGDGSFVCYSPAAICKLDLEALTVEEAASSKKYSYLKPICYGGKLYALRIPAKEKETNPIIDILLIPYRILQAIVNFVNVFVHAFTGKSLASGGNNPAKGREYDSREEFIKGNLINVEKESKKNRKKDGEYGFIPMSWQVVEVESGAVIRSGVADYDILSDGTFIVTNGKHIFSVKDGKSKKLCDTERCLTLAARHETKTKNSLFEF